MPFMKRKACPDHSQARRSPRLAKKLKTNTIKSTSQVSLETIQPNCQNPIALEVAQHEQLRKQHPDTSKQAISDNSRERLHWVDVTPATSEAEETHRERISHWIRRNIWPREQQEPWIGSRASPKTPWLVKGRQALFAEHSDSSIAETTQSNSLSDPQPREQKSTPYKHRLFENQLLECGSYMDDHPEGISVRSKALCQQLLETKQSLPTHSLFSDDDVFKKTLRRLRGENETKVIRELMEELVPSAERLADRGHQHLEIVRETADACWTNSIRFFDRPSAPLPQPDFSIGFKAEAFNQQHLRKLEPFVGDVLKDSSHIVARYNMYLPFLTSEVKCGASALDIADRQNAYSQSTALRGLVQLFRMVGRENDLHREICGFSISHDDKDVRIWGHYPVISEKNSAFYRYAIARFNISPTAEGDQRWKAYTFVRNVYDLWLPGHFKRLCDVIDLLPSDWNRASPDADPDLESTRSGLSQQLQNYEQAVYATDGHTGEHNPD